jgi:membrane protein
LRAAERTEIEDAVRAFVERIREIPGILREAFDAWNRDKAPRLGAAVAFYTALSLSPLLILALLIAGAVFGEEAARGQVADQLEELMGREGASVVQSILLNAQRPGHGLIASIIGFATLLFGASGVFGELQEAMNTIWNVKPKEGAGWLEFVKDRAFAFAMVLGAGVVLLALIVLGSVLDAFPAAVARVVPLPDWMFLPLNLLVSFGVFTLLFAVLFRVLPEVDISWKDVWGGALITSALFLLGRYLIGLYLSRNSFGSSYGAAGSLVALLFWVYYSAQIFFFGAEITRVEARRADEQAAQRRDGRRVDLKRAGAGLRAAGE